MAEGGYAAGAVLPVFKRHAISGSAKATATANIASSPCIL